MALIEILIIGSSLFWAHYYSAPSLAIKELFIKTVRSGWPCYVAIETTIFLRGFVVVAWP